MNEPISPIYGDDAEVSYDTGITGGDGSSYLAAMVDPLNHIADMPDAVFFQHVLKRTTGGDTFKTTTSSGAIILRLESGGYTYAEHVAFTDDDSGLGTVTKRFGLSEYLPDTFDEGRVIQLAATISFGGPPMVSYTIPGSIVAARIYNPICDMVSVDGTNTVQSKYGYSAIQSATANAEDKIPPVNAGSGVAYTPLLTNINCRPLRLNDKLPYRLPDVPMVANVTAKCMSNDQNLMVPIAYDLSPQEVSVPAGTTINFVGPVVNIPAAGGMFTGVLDLKYTATCADITPGPDIHLQPGATITPFDIAQNPLPAISLDLNETVFHDDDEKTINVSGTFQYPMDQAASNIMPGISQLETQIHFHNNSAQDILLVIQGRAMWNIIIPNGAYPGQTRPWICIVYEQMTVPTQVMLTYCTNGALVPNSNTGKSFTATLCKTKATELQSLQDIMGDAQSIGHRNVWTYASYNNWMTNARQIATNNCMSFSMKDLDEASMDGDASGFTKFIHGVGNKLKRGAKKITPWAANEAKKFAKNTFNNVLKKYGPKVVEKALSLAAQYAPEAATAIALLAGGSAAGGSAAGNRIPMGGLINYIKKNIDVKGIARQVQPHQYAVLDLIRQALAGVTNNTIPSDRFLMADDEKDYPKLGGEFLYFGSETYFNSPISQHAFQYIFDSNSEALKTNPETWKCSGTTGKTEQVTSSVDDANDFVFVGLDEYQGERIEYDGFSLVTNPCQCAGISQVQCFEIIDWYNKLKQDHLKAQEEILCLKSGIEHKNRKLKTLKSVFSAVQEERKVLLDKIELLTSLKIANPESTPDKKVKKTEVPSPVLTSQSTLQVSKELVAPLQPPKFLITNNIEAKVVNGNVEIPNRNDCKFTSSELQALMKVGAFSSTADERKFFTAWKASFILYKRPTLLPMKNNPTIAPFESTRYLYASHLAGSRSIMSRVWAKCLKQIMLLSSDNRTELIKMFDKLEDNGQDAKLNELLRRILEDKLTFADLLKGGGVCSSGKLPIKPGKKMLATREMKGDDGVYTVDYDGFSAVAPYIVETEENGTAIIRKAGNLYVTMSETLYHLSTDNHPVRGCSETSLSVAPRNASAWQLVGAYMKEGIMKIMVTKLVRTVSGRSIEFALRAIMHAKSRNRPIATLSWFTGVVGDKTDPHKLNEMPPNIATAKIVGFITFLKFNKDLYGGIPMVPMYLNTRLELITFNIMLKSSGSLAVIHKVTTLRTVFEEIDCISQSRGLAPVESKMWEILPLDGTFVFKRRDHDVPTLDLKRKFEQDHVDEAHCSDRWADVDGFGTELDLGDGMEIGFDGISNVGNCAAISRIKAAKSTSTLTLAIAHNDLVTNLVMKDYDVSQEVAVGLILLGRILIAQVGNNIDMIVMPKVLSFGLNRKVVIAQTAEVSNVFERERKVDMNTLYEMFIEARATVLVPYNYGAIIDAIKLKAGKRIEYVDFNNILGWLQTEQLKAPTPEDKLIRKPKPTPKPKAQPKQQPKQQPQLLQEPAVHQRQQNPDGKSAGGRNKNKTTKPNMSVSQDEMRAMMNLVKRLGTMTQQ